MISVPLDYSLLLLIDLTLQFNIPQFYIIVHMP